MLKLKPKIPRDVQNSVFRSQNFKTLDQKINKLLQEQHSIEKFNPVKDNKELIEKLDKFD